MKKNYIERTPMKLECGKCAYYLRTNRYVFGRSICTHGMAVLPETDGQWKKVKIDRDVSVEGICDEFTLDPRYLPNG